MEQDAIQSQQNCCCCGIYTLISWYVSPYHFQSSFYINSLAPRYCRVSQAVSSTASPGDIHTLSSEVTESLCYDKDCIMGQCRRILQLMQIKYGDKLQS